MEKTIIFKKYMLDELNRDPKFFDTAIDGHATLSLVDCYGVLYGNNKKTAPFYFIHHCNPDRIRFSGISRLGVGYDSVQTPLHGEDLVQKNDEIDGYRRIDENCWGMDCCSKGFELRVYQDCVTVKDRGIMELTGSLFPYAIFKHADKSTITSQITQTVKWKGVLDGEPVEGLGNFELMYMPEGDKRELNQFASYIYAQDIGIRLDGRCETSMVFCNLKGQGNACYWLEGNTPIVTDKINIEATWTHLPYMNDGTCTYKDAVIRYANQEIHFFGCWGQKGLTANPRTELGGQSQEHGTWYAGPSPYEHKMSFTFHENMDVYDYKLKASGYTVI